MLDICREKIAHKGTRVECTQGCSLSLALRCLIRHLFTQRVYVPTYLRFHVEHVSDGGLCEHMHAAIGWHAVDLQLREAQRRAVELRADDERDERVDENQKKRHRRQRTDGAQQARIPARTGKADGQEQNNRE